jgi:hypothetical protein
MLKEYLGSWSVIVVSLLVILVLYAMMDYGKLDDMMVMVTMTMTSDDEDVNEDDDTPSPEDQSAHMVRHCVRVWPGWVRL